MFTAAQLRFSDIGASNLEFDRWKLKLKKGNEKDWKHIETALLDLKSETSALCESPGWELGLLCDALEWNDLTHAFDEDEGEATQ